MRTRVHIEFAGTVQFKPNGQVWVRDEAGILEVSAVPVESLWARLIQALCWWAADALADDGFGHEAGYSS